MKHNILLWMTVCLLGTSCSNILDKEPDFVSPDYYYNTESISADLVITFSTRILT